MYALKKKDWPTVSGHTPVLAKYVGNSICVATRDGDIINLILKDGKYQSTRAVPIHTLQVISISVASDNSFIATTAMDGKCVISVPKGDTFQMQREIECPNAIFPHVAIAPTDNSLIAIVGNNGCLYIEKNQQIKEYKIDNDTFVDLAFYGSNSQYIIAVGRHSISQIDSATGVPLDTLKLNGELKRHIHCVAAHPNSKIFAVGTFDRFVEFYTIDQSPKKLFEVSIPHDKVGEKVKVIEEIMFMSDGKTVVVGSSNGSVTLIDIEQRAIVKTNKFQRSRIFSVAVSPNDREILSVSDDKTILCIDVSEE